MCVMVTCVEDELRKNVHDVERRQLVSTRLQTHTQTQQSPTASGYPTVTKGPGNKSTVKQVH